MGIGKSKITPSINVDDMLKKAESNHELEAEKTGCRQAAHRNP